MTEIGLTEHGTHLAAGEAGTSHAPGVVAAGRDGSDVHVLRPSLPALRGTARDVGRAHGAAFASQVHASVRACRRRVEEVLGLPRLTTLQFAGDAHRPLRDLAAGLIAEIYGIADGADVDVLEIAALHVRTALSCMVER